MNVLDMLMQGQLGVHINSNEQANHVYKWILEQPGTYDQDIPWEGDDFKDFPYVCCGGRPGEWFPTGTPAPDRRKYCVEYGDFVNAVEPECENESEVSCSVEDVV